MLLNSIDWQAGRSGNAKRAKSILPTAGALVCDFRPAAAGPRGQICAPLVFFHFHVLLFLFAGLPTARSSAVPDFSNPSTS